MNKILESFKEFNRKHKKLARFLVYPEIVIITLGSVIRYLIRHFLVAAAILVIVLVAIFAIKKYGGGGRQSSDASMVTENVVVGESTANGEMPDKDVNEATLTENSIAMEAKEKEEAIDETTEVNKATEDKAADIEASDESSNSEDALSSGEEENIATADAEEKSSEDAASEEKSADDATSEEPAIGETVADDATSEETASVETEADDATPEKTAPEEPASAEEVTVTEASSEQATDVPTIVPGQDINAIFNQYPEAVAWITFEDGLLDCPVMQDGDNNKYRIKDYTGEDSNTGAIFMDFRSSSGLDDPNTIIYGHNMKDYSMFGIFKYYRDDKSFLKDHKYFNITTPDGRGGRYMIFAYMNAPKDSDIYEVVGDSSDKMRAFLDKIEYRTFIDTGIEPTVDDKIITLSTCTESDDLYFVLFAVKCD